MSRDGTPKHQVTETKQEVMGGDGTTKAEDIAKVKDPKPEAKQKQDRDGAPKHQVTETKQEVTGGDGTPKAEDVAKIKDPKPEAKQKQDRDGTSKEEPETESNKPDVVAKRDATNSPEHKEKEDRPKHGGTSGEGNGDNPKHEEESEPEPYQLDALCTLCGDVGHNEKDCDYSTT